MTNKIGTYLALKAADFIKMDDDTSALDANLGNIVALENDLIPPALSLIKIWLSKLKYLLYLEMLVVVNMKEKDLQDKKVFN